MKIKWIGRLYACLFYEAILQIALWFLITFIILISLGDHYQISSAMLSFVLWLSSGIYFIYSWKNGGQTLPMVAWKLKLLPPKNHKLNFYIYRYILVSVGSILFLSFFLYILLGQKQYLHDLFLKSKIIYTQTC